MIHFELMRPNVEDAEQVRIWRNDPLSLAMSIHYTQLKSFHEFYPEFLRNYFSSPLPSLFAIHEGHRIGCLRFDPAKDDRRGLSCEISLLVAPAFRQKGYGLQILNGIDPILKRQQIHVIHAQIRKQNAASIKTFTRAGYVTVKTSSEFLETEKVLLPPPSEKVLIIAEAGSNWYAANDQAGQGEKRAYQMIDAAKEAGADAVKFQTFRAEDIYVENAGLSDYLSHQGIQEDITSLFKELSLSDVMVFKLAEYAKKVGIEFLSSVFSPRDFALIDPLVNRHKIASYEINHLRLIELVAKSGKPLILSTGASTPSEIDWAVDTFKKNGGTSLTLLQCTAKYPAPPESLNLNVIPWLKKRYQVEAGLSDHSMELSSPIAAVALGATCIEKHFTLDRGLSGPDHSFAIEPAELKKMVQAIREVELMLGSSLKTVEEIEKELYFFAKRGIQSLRDICKGEILLEGENIAILRPGKRSLGLHSKHMPHVHGKIALRDIKKGEGVQFNDI